MDPVWLLILLPIAAASGWMMANRDRAQSENSPSDHTAKVPESFYKGLNLLLNEQPDRALDVFLDATELDQDTVEMHVALGNLFRRRGEIERATQIHQNLVARSDLEPGMRALALYELAQDYFKAGLFDRAEGLLQELRQVEEYQEQACRFLLQIYDQEKEWHSAIVIGEELASLTRQDFGEPLAQYCCELAELAISEGKAGKAEYYLDSALKYVDHCTRATLISGRVAATRGNHRAAIAKWCSLEDVAPQSLGEVVPMISESYEALGDQRGFRHFLERAIEVCPDSRIISALVEITRDSKGKLAGQRLLIDIVKKYPNLEGLYQLLRNRTAPEILRGESIDLELITALLSESVGQSREYQCRQCGFNCSSLHWQCPGCKEWGSVQKRTLVKDRTATKLAPNS
ncbi:MAG: lipopolysaccharide assembly protein LapB [Acidiferrobacterales bacterium]|nr:lipopolysaccharide assembly protein LapB [Acidiferrobacterales bacterium]